MAQSSTLRDKIAEVTERVAASEGLEVVEVELRGGGGNRLLRITIDKPEGVSLNDCENLSRQLGTILDVEELVPGGRYQLEVTSPGLERKLFRPKDFERFAGQPVKISLQQARDGRKTFEGRLGGYEEGAVILELPEGGSTTFHLDEILRANLKFEWR